MKRNREEEKTDISALEESAACTHERVAAIREKKNNEQRKFKKPPGNN
jgi:hypothetical protein